MPALGKPAINSQEPATPFEGERELFGGVSGKKKAEGKEDTSLIQRDPSNPTQLFLFIIVRIFLVSSYLPA